MSTALEASRLVIRMFGPMGLVREIATAILEIEADPATDGPAPMQDRVTLVVLVDPGPSDWDIALGHGAPVILVTGQALDAVSAADAILRGADAVVHAGTDPGTLLEAVRVLVGGGALLDPGQARALVIAARAKAATSTGAVPLSLTPRERQILASIARGDAVKQTAIALDISAKTVENLQGRLFCKLGVHNRTHAVTRAYELGLLSRPPRGGGQQANERDSC